MMRKRLLYSHFIAMLQHIHDEMECMACFFSFEAYAGLCSDKRTSAYQQEERQRMELPFVS